MTRSFSLRTYGGCERGVAALEFAIVTPFLILLLLGGFEMARFLIVQQKAEKIAFSVADVTAQYESVTSTEISQVFAAVEQIMKPHPFNTNGRVILSSVYNPDGTEKPKVRWQCENAGALNVVSKVGKVGNDATLPQTFLLDEKDNLIVTEVFYRFTPVFKTIFTGPFVVYRTAMFRPRLGALTSAPGC